MLRFSRDFNHIPFSRILYTALAYFKKFFLWFLQSELTLWRLKFFVKDALEVQGKITSKGDNSNSVNLAVTNPNISAASKRKKEICDALVKNAKKRNKKPSK